MKRIIIKREDIIYVNGQKHLPDDLEEGDLVEVITTVNRTRRTATSTKSMPRGRAASPRASFAKDDLARTLDMSTGDNTNSENLKLFVPSDTPILLNGARTLKGKPVTLASLVSGDRLKVSYDYQESSGNKASKLEALRQVELQGALAADFDARTRLLSIVNGQQQVVKLPFGSQYIISVNGRPEAEPAALKRGDRVTIKHDSYISEVVAERTLGAEGVIAHVAFDPPHSLSVAGEGGQKNLPRRAGVQDFARRRGRAVRCARAGDRVTIEHGTIDAKNQSAIAAASISAERPTDPQRRAMVIAVQNYDDTKLGKLAYPLADAAAVADAMTKRIACLRNNARIRRPKCGDAPRETPEFLKRIPADARLIVYFDGHAMKDAKGHVYLAPKDFRSDKPDVNGLSLQWLVDLMEECPAKEKLLLLDGSHAGGAEQASEPSPPK